VPWYILIDNHRTVLV